MSNINDFVIENGVLTKYVGEGGEVVIPEGVTSIGDRAFYDCTSLASVTIPDSVTSIGIGAFDGCENLTSVTIPDSVTSIGIGAFDGCENLTSVTIPEGVTSIGNMAFFCCTSLTSVTIPEGVTSIGGWAFYGCKSLTSITIPEDVTSIGKEAFIVSGIQKVTFEGSEISISRGAFPDNDNTEYFAPNAPLSAFSATMKQQLVYTYLSQTEEYHPIHEEEYKKYITKSYVNLIKKAIQSDDSDMISKILKICKISIDKIDELISEADKKTEIKALLLDHKSKLFSVEDVEKNEQRKFDIELGIKQRNVAEWKKEYTFEKNETGITIVSYKGTDETVIVPDMIGNDKVTAIGETAFSPTVSRVKNKSTRKKLYQVVLPTTVKKIGSQAFSCCTSLTSVTIPEGVTSIGYGAFEYCRSLTSVTIPDSVTSIGNSAFYGCKNLTSIIIPDSVTNIGGVAFYGCENLTSIIVPDSVTSIGNGAFCGCKNLTIHVPAGSYAEAYAKENNIPFIAE